MLSGCIRNGSAYTQSDGAVLTIPERGRSTRVASAQCSCPPTNAGSKLRRFTKKKQDAISLVGFMLISAMLER